jgi:hypothetical protein
MVKFSFWDVKRIAISKVFFKFSLAEMSPFEHKKSIKRVKGVQFSPQMGRRAYK